MRVLVDINHPSQAHLFRPVLRAWGDQGYDYVVVARDKDITLPLLESFGIPYTVLTPIGRGSIGQLKELIRREWAMLSFARKFRPDIITGSSVNAVRVARLLRAKSVILCEDDAKYIPHFRRLAYPFASAIVTPDSLAYENRGARHLTYPSYQKLFYLHPNRFTPDRTVVKELGIGEDERYGLIRLSSLQAHHDSGVRGMNERLIRDVANLVENDMRLFITSEKPLPAEFEHLRLPISAERIHHALAFAEFFLGDSQSMTMESALLGTPAFKINSFAGIISVIKELEQFGLAYGYRPDQEDLLIQELTAVLQMDNRKAEFQNRRDKMLSKRIDPLPWFLAVIRMFLEGASVRQVNEWSAAVLTSGQFVDATRSEGV